MFDPDNKPLHFVAFVAMVTAAFVVTLGVSGLLLVWLIRALP